MASVDQDRDYVARFGLYGFLQRAWPIVVQGDEYEDNWHIKVICDDLTEKARQRHQNNKGSKTAISVPPGSTKSIIATVMYQCWVWTFWPESRWITATYEEGMAFDFSRDTREIIGSDWYQERWPLGLKTSKVGFWKNSKGGFRKSVGIKGAITGKHAHFHVGDDLVKEQKATRGTQTEIMNSLSEANDFWFGTMTTRRIGEPVKVLIQQRLHRDDTVGKAEDQGYERICLPLHANKSVASSHDKREVEGEVLDKRYTPEVIAEMETGLGPTNSKSQLEQDPVPPGGQLLFEEYLSHRYEVLTGKLRRAIENEEQGVEQYWATYWDFAFKGKEQSSWVVGQAWVRYKGEYILIDEVREHTGFKGSVRMMKDIESRYPFIRAHKLEDAANASAIQEELEHEMDGITLLPHGGGTLARTQAVEGIWASGAVILPARANYMGGGDGFFVEHTHFDGLKTRPDDRVSASSLAILDMSSKKRSKWIDAMRKARKERLGR